MNYYDEQSLSRALKQLEDRHGFTSEGFYRRHVSDDPSVKSVSGFVRHLWAGLYLDSCRLSGVDPICGVHDGTLCA
jgi:hypothetical protein